MAIPEGKAPIIESVRAAVRLWLGALPQTAPLAIAGGVAIVLLGQTAVAGAGQNPFALLILGLLPLLARALIYTTQMHAAAAEAPDWPRRLSDGLKVFAALCIVSFFLFIVFFVAAIPGTSILITAANVSEQDIAALGQDQAAMVAFFTRLVRENPQTAGALFLLYGALWYFLTSRLYLVAPASAAEGRIRTFETWAWTKNNMLRITAMRLLLLAPPYLLIGLVTAQLAPLVQTMGAPGALGLRLASESLAVLVVGGLEAALSVYLYRGLKPPAPAQAP